MNGAAGPGPAGRISGFFIDSKLTPLIAVAALALGALAVALTPREEEPQIVVPIVDLFVGLPGASPLEVENRVTVPLEKRLWGVPGVEYVYSASRPGQALVTVRFYVGEDQERSLVKVWEELLSGMDRMPAGATPPLVKLRTIDDVPILALTLWRSWDERRVAAGLELRRIAAELGRELAALDDVSTVSLSGGLRRQVRVLLDPARLTAAGLDPVAVAQAVTAQNASLDAGSFETPEGEVLVETGGFLESAADVAGLVVAAPRGRPVYLEDVARIVDAGEDPQSFVLFVPGPSFAHGSGDGRRETAGEAFPAVTLSVAKRKGADASRVVGAVMDRVEELRLHMLPEEVELTVTRDYGATAREKADELLVHLAAAIVAVTLVIGLALGWRAAVVVFVSVPVSFALTLLVYYLFDYTLNRVTLFALIFVTGIVVDDSIIVVENIVRHMAMRRGESPREAAIRAVGEVGNPTILATLTVIAAVLPMAFVRGLMGPYMRPMPVGASLAMIFSLLVALVAAPWLALRLLRSSPKLEGDYEAEGGDLEASRVYRIYRSLMAPLLERALLRWAALAGVAGLLVVAIGLLPLGLVTVKMLPFDNKSELQVIVDMPEGTTLETTSRVAREMAAALGEVAEVRDVQIYVGTAAPINFNGLVRHYDLRHAPNVADLQVNFVHKEERERKSHELALAIRPLIETVAERYRAAFTVAEVPPGPPVLATLVAEVYGPTRQERLAVAREVLEIFRSSEGVADVDWTPEALQVKKVFVVDGEKAALHGVPAVRVSEVLRLALEGGAAGVLHAEREAEPVSVLLQLDRPDRSSVAGLEAVRLRSLGGAAVPVSELVRVETSTLEGTRHRKNLKPVVYVTAEVGRGGEGESPVYAILAMNERVAQLSGSGGASVRQLYRDEPSSIETPALKWDGEWHITYEVFRDLGAAFVAVLLLIYVLIVAWFGSFATPLVMMIAIPLSLVGILPGHALFGAFFTATSMIGFIALAGIMVRNSILLIDFVGLARQRGENLEEAVIQAGAVRLRPILLTAGTVIVGAFVILFDPIFEGLAISLLTGAFASTGLTLVVVPLVYTMAERHR